MWIQCRRHGNQVGRQTCHIPETRLASVLGGIRRRGRGYRALTPDWFFFVLKNQSEVLDFLTPPPNLPETTLEEFWLLSLAPSLRRLALASPS